MLSGSVLLLNYFDIVDKTIFAKNGCIFVNSDLCLEWQICIITLFDKTENRLIREFRIIYVH